MQSPPAAPPAASSSYRAWLACYAQPDFQAVTLEAIAIVEQAARGAAAPERAEMRRSFHASAEHELAFFDQTT